METRHHAKQMRKTEKYLLYWRNHLINQIDKITNRRVREEKAKDLAGEVQEIIENLRIIDDLLIHYLHTETTLRVVEGEVSTFHEESRDDGIHIVSDDDPYDQFEYKPGEVIE